MESRELDGLTFRCLEGCGFCCTFQPELSTLEMGKLRRATKSLKVVSDGERNYLGLHNKCGACTLLERRNCTQYDLRPAHCRYFPFHVHFAPFAEVNVNYTCRGVARAPGADLRAAFASSVTATAKRDEWARHETASRAAYAEFERRAKRAGAWSAIPAPTEVRAGPLDVALAPFGAADITKRPFYLTADLEWLTFERQGDARLTVLEMDEKGALLARGDVKAALDDDAAIHLPYLQRLVARGAFAGSVYALVDESSYETTVADATCERLDEIGADLLLRASIVRQLGTSGIALTPAVLADETARFYDSQFLDAPTIGAWL
jgi:Fe-S-cluster containining protein